MKLAACGEIKKIIVDTNYFKGNFPDSCSIDVCYRPDANDDSLTDAGIDWKELLPKTKLKGDFENTFIDELKKPALYHMPGLIFFLMAELAG